jgi:hypothetical protein
MLAVVAIVAVPFANADTIGSYGISGYSITADLSNTSGTNYNLALTITNNTGTTGFVQGFSIQLFSNNIASASLPASPSLPYTTTGSASLAPNSPAFLVAANSQATNSTTGTGANVCNGTGNGFGSVCDILTGGYLGLAQGQSLTLYVKLDSGAGNTLLATTQWHLISNATVNSDGTGGNAYAISANAPEPSSLGFLGISLLSVTGVLRWRKKKN